MVVYRRGKSASAEWWLVQTVRVGGRRPGCDEPERYARGRRAAGWQGLVVSWFTGG